MLKIISLAGILWLVGFVGVSQAATPKPDSITVQPIEADTVEDVAFSWTVPDGVIKVAVDVSSSSKAEPMTVFEPPISEYAIDTDPLTDGNWYFNVQFKDEDGWGEVTSLPLPVDNTPPLPFSLRVVSSDTYEPVLFFEAVDTKSGIMRYDVTVSGYPTVYLKPEEAELGYKLSGYEPGSYTVRVAALDWAGNVTNSIAPLLLSSTAGTAAPVADTNTNSELLAFNLLLIILVLFAYIIYSTRQINHREAEAREETWQAHDQMQKIFSALRDEIYEQIDSINKRPRLSKKEKEVVDSLNKTLKVSETLIDKEIEDIKQVLKKG